MSHWDVVTSSEGQQHKAGTPAGVRAGNLVFLSAVRGVDPATQVVVDGAEAQARQAFENVRVALAAAGGALTDVVKVGVFMSNLQRDRPVFNKVWHEYFPERSPARFAVQVTDMGAKGDDTLFLLDVTAVLPDA